MTDRELMGQALDVLEDIFGKNKIDVGVINRLRDRLAQPEQEPVAWMYHGIRHDDTPHERPSLIWKLEYMDVMSAEKGATAAPLYTAPREWQGLTDEEVSEILGREIGFNSCFGPETDFARAIEARLKEKNT